MARFLPILAFPCLLLLAACEPPNVDPGTDGPGSIPDITGAMQGTVLYVGQRPECDYEGDTPTAVRGNVILLLFLSDNPPPPQGSATSASSLLALSGGELFRLSDCLPPEPTPADLQEVLTRSADFDWPEIALARGEGARVDYQVRGFFDRDADFNPFFSVRRLASRGDVAGGAFVNTAANPPQFERIRFGSVDDESGRNGDVVSGVAVTLGAVVNTELPASRLGDGTQALSSEATVPATTDAIMREQMLWDYTRMRLRLIDPTEQSWAQTLAAAGMSINPHPSGFGWFTLSVDANRDGDPDLHPTLGAAGVFWQHPIVIVRRARNPLELAVGIPDTVIIATVRPSQTLTKTTFAPEIDIAVVPVAAVTLDASRPECRIPYIPPGNIAETYERVPVDCHELPTGNYDVNVLTGIAGGRASDFRQATIEATPGLPDAVVNSIVRGRTDNDWIIEGGQFSSQAWSIPNELGCPDVLYRRDLAGNLPVSQVDADPSTTCGPPEGPCNDSETNMHCSQGPAGRFSVVDPTHTDLDPTNNTPGHGVAECQTAVSIASGMSRTVRYMDIPEGCCAPIEHLCGLPLCPLRQNAALANGTSRGIREIRNVDEDYRMNEDGSITPLCVPFLMPAGCCGS